MAFQMKETQVTKPAITFDQIRKHHKLQLLITGTLIKPKMVK